MVPEKPKPQPSVNFDINKFLTYYSLLKIESYTATQEDEQKDSIYEKIQVEIKSFFVQRIWLLKLKRIKS